LSWVYARLRCDACACGERRREYPSVRTSKRRMPRALRVQRTREARAASSNNFSRGSGRAARAPAARRIHAAAIGFPTNSPAIRGESGPTSGCLAWRVTAGCATSTCPSRRGGSYSVGRLSSRPGGRPNAPASRTTPAARTRRGERCEMVELRSHARAHGVAAERACTHTGRMGWFPPVPRMARRGGWRG
jgi:hypothetical protein